MRTGGDASGVLRAFREADALMLFTLERRRTRWRAGARGVNPKALRALLVKPVVRRLGELKLEADGSAVAGASQRRWLTVGRGSAV